MIDERTFTEWTGQTPRHARAEMIREMRAKVKQDKRTSFARHACAVFGAAFFGALILQALIK